MRILHFSHIINRCDIIDSVLTRLDRSRFQVSALTGMPSRSVGAYEASEAYETRCLDFPFTRASYPRMLWALLRQIRRFRPDIVHAHHYDENVIASIAVRLAGVPCYIGTRHYSDHIYILTRGLKRAAFLKAEAFYISRANRVLVPVESDARFLVHQQRVPREKVEVLPFGFDFGRARISSPEAPERLRKSHGLEGKYVALTCCRLNREKGLDYLIPIIPEVKARHQDFRLVMVGSGSLEEKLRREIAELGIGDVVQMVGWRDDSMDWIAAADLVIQPSRGESFCQVLLEALALKKPVVMTPVGAGPEIIGQNERGRLVPIGDCHALMTSICELASDRMLGQKLGELGYAYIKDHFSVDVATQRHEVLYSNCRNEIGTG